MVRLLLELGFDINTRNAAGLHPLSEAVLHSDEVAEAVRQLREQGAPEARVYQYREQRLGAEAAERLGELDRRREAWRERYQAYQAQRRAIEDSGLAEEDREDAIQRLRASLFDEAEQRRVRALDRIGG